MSCDINILSSAELCWEIIPIFILSPPNLSDHIRSSNCISPLCFPVAQRHRGSSCKSEFKAAWGRRHLNLHTNSATLLSTGKRSWKNPESKSPSARQICLGGGSEDPTHGNTNGTGPFAYDLRAQRNVQHRICQTVVWAGRARHDLNWSLLWWRTLEGRTQYSIQTHNRACTHTPYRHLQTADLQKACGKYSLFYSTMQQVCLRVIISCSWRCGLPIDDIPKPPKYHCSRPSAPKIDLAGCLAPAFGPVGHLWEFGIGSKNNESTVGGVNIMTWSEMCRSRL